MLLRDYINQYFESEIQTYEELSDRTMERVQYFGSYRFLENKTKEEIKYFKHVDIENILSGLYSTQRPNVLSSLTELLHADGGLSFFKGVLNQLKDRKQDIDAFHETQKTHLKKFKQNTGNFKLAFGKNTISQLAHFCAPSIYAISNTKSQTVVLELLDINVDNNYNQFETIANEICAELQAKCEEVFDIEMGESLKTYKYVVLDDFIEYVYDRIV